jgi:hypothetical protein
VAKVEVFPGLEAEVARMIRPAVQDVVDQVEHAAKEKAPAAKVWVTRHDPRVRHSHEVTDGQLIPANLRYKVARVVYIRKGRSPHGKAVNLAGGWRIIEGEFELARRPLDPALSIENRIRCRCRSIPLPGLVAASIHAGPVMVAGARLSATIATEFPRAAESEFGTDEDQAARFFRGAIEQVAARYR